MTGLCAAQLAVGDIIYLAFTGPAQYQHGFQLLGPEQPLAGQEEQAASSSASALRSNINQDSSAHAGCFKGKHIVFWTRSHTATLKQKATQAGAILEHKITELTQLVVAARDTSATDAAAHLADVPPSVPLRSKKWEGRKLKIPTTVDFVVPQYISDCLVQARILPTGAYQIALQQVATKDTRTYSNEECAVDASEPQEVSYLNSTDPTSGQPPHKDIINAHSADHVTPGVSSNANPQLQPQKMLPEATMQKAAPPEQSGAGQQVDPPPEKKIGIYPDVNPHGRSFTGGHSGIAWGTAGLRAYSTDGFDVGLARPGGQWEEPWDQKSALKTIEKLERHWYQLDGAAAAAAGPSPGAGEPTGESDDSCGSDDEGPPKKQLKATVNKVCVHVACSAQTVCLIEQLQIVRDNYRGRIDQFRIKAVERAISELTRLQKPLRTESDVTELSMGARSKEKVLEIMETGTLRRNEMLADDEEQQVIQLFLKVWGAAEATCLRWYASGCRTLDDIRARADLTEQQVAGLKHFDDMQQRIPRSEVEQETLPGQPSMILGSSLNCRQKLKSLLLFSGDIDFLIMAPASREPVACGAVLQALLARLLQQGLLVDEMSPSRPRPRETGSATWLGLCKPPGSPYVRRIDFKVYPARYTAFAVNYFIGSGPFVRALRYWARTATKSLAQQVAPSANGFKLTDTVLVPLIVQPKQRLEKGQVKSVDVLVPPGVHCNNETQIFEALGLAYVPPYMRYFGSNYQ
ncbi:MAG: DNA polymerase lambda [Trebouxia sp. A1-2]|nr:MAG: DNA polymerase lambda [Trebouxia sp. A1-2]